MCLAQKTALVVFDLPTTSLKELKEPKSKLEADWKYEAWRSMAKHAKHVDDIGSRIAFSQLLA